MPCEAPAAIAVAAVLFAEAEPGGEGGEPTVTAADTAPAGTRKNIMYVVVDDLRGELGFTSSTKGLVSPNLDKLAARATVFERCCEEYLPPQQRAACASVVSLCLAAD